MSDGTVFVVDDDSEVRDSLRMLLEVAGLSVQCFMSAKAFLDQVQHKPGCLVTDIRMPDMNGLELLEEVGRRGLNLPVIVITGHGDIALAVRAMKAGAVDFIEKPFDDEQILTSVSRALQLGSKARDQAAEVRAASELLTLLTPRERDVLNELVQGHPNKVVAHRLGISPRTVEIHRAHLMKKMNATSLSDIVRLVLTVERGS